MEEEYTSYDVTKLYTRDGDGFPMMNPILTFVILFIAGSIFPVIMIALVLNSPEPITQDDFRMLRIGISVSIIAYGFGGGVQSIMDALGKVAKNKLEKANDKQTLDSKSENKIR